MKAFIIYFSLVLSGYATNVEEGFRHRNNLSFKMPFNVQGKEQIIDFSDAHELLKQFESGCQTSYLQKIEELEKNVSPAYKKAHYGEGLKSWKDKNIAVFSMSLLVKNGSDFSCVTLSPITPKQELPDSNIQKKFLLSRETRKVFISGDSLPYCSGLPKPQQKLSSLSANAFDFPLYALEQATGIEDIRPEKGKQVIKASERADYLDKDLCIGRIDKTKFYGGLFQGERDWQRVIGQRIKDKFSRIERHREKITDQWDGWGASLVDSEQSLRIFFQKNIQQLVDVAITHIQSMYNQKAQQKYTSGDEGKIEDHEIEGQPKAEILGLFLHIHSRMDMCEVCSASTYGFMRSFNDYLSVGKAGGYQLPLSSSASQKRSSHNYMLDEFLSALDLLRK